MVGHIRKVSSIYSGLFRMQQLLFYPGGIRGLRVVPGLVRYISPMISAQRAAILFLSSPSPITMKIS